MDSNESGAAVAELPMHRVAALLAGLGVPEVSVQTLLGHQFVVGSRLDEPAIA